VAVRKGLEANAEFVVRRNAATTTSRSEQAVRWIDIIKDFGVLLAWIMHKLGLDFGRCTCRQDPTGTIV
jgi:hypothetical protein